MKRITKAFTLVELIVSMLIFGILMVGVMQLIAPIQNSATISRVSNNQQTVENAISTFIGENVRYASNLVIVQQGVQVKADQTGSQVTVNSAEDAIKAFFLYNPKKGNQYLDPTSSKNKGLVNVIAFDTSSNTAYRYPANTANQYTGRIVSSIEYKDATTKNVKARTTALNFANVTDFKGTSPQYEVFGNAYYGPADYYLTVKINDVAKTLDIQVSSKYYYNPGSKKYIESGHDSTNWSNNKRSATTASFELRNYRVSITDYVFKCLTKNPTAGACVTQHGDTNSTIYFVYTLDDSKNDDKFDVLSDANYTNPMVFGTGADITNIDSTNGTTVNRGESGGFANNNGTSNSSGSNSNSGGNTGGGTGGNTGGGTGGNTGGGTGGNTGNGNGGDTGNGNGGDTGNGNGGDTGNGNGGDTGDTTGGDTGNGNGGDTGNGNGGDTGDTTGGDNQNNNPFVPDRAPVGGFVTVGSIATPNSSGQYTQPGVLDAHSSGDNTVLITYAVGNNNDQTDSFTLINNGDGTYKIDLNGSTAEYKIRELLGLGDWNNKVFDVNDPIAQNLQNKLGISLYNS